MDYKELIERYAKNGGGDEKKMWASIAVTSKAMDYIKETNPGMYDCLTRELSEVLNGKHYSEEFAKKDVAKLQYTNANGEKKTGAYWTKDEIEAATANQTFPKGTTVWDKYVAYNATYADFCKKFDDEQILCMAYIFWFSDEDWKSDGKIWDYMSINK